MDTVWHSDLPAATTAHSERLLREVGVAIVTTVVVVAAA